MAGLGRAAPWAPLVFLCGALSLTLDGQVAGFPLLLASVPVAWVTGLWARPGSPDAYVRRVARILRESYDRIREATDKELKRAAVVTSEVAASEPSAKYLEARQDLLERLLEGDADTAERSGTLEQRTDAAIARRDALMTLKSSLRAGSHPDGYYEWLQNRIERRLDTARNVVEVADAVLAETREELTRVKVPSRWGGRHTALLSAFDGYRAAILAYYRAVESGDRSDGRRAVGDLGEWTRCLERARDANRQRLLSGGDSDAATG
jgi:hypothetical protein